MAWIDGGNGQWVWQGIVTETGVPEQPSQPPPSAGRAAPAPASGSSGQVPAFSGPNPTGAYDPSLFRPPGAVQNPGTFAPPTSNPLSGRSLFDEEFERAIERVPEVPTATPNAPPPPGTPPPATLSAVDRLRALDATTNAPTRPVADTAGGGRIAPTVLDAAIASRVDDSLRRAATPTPQPGDAAPDVDRTRVNALLNDVGRATSGLMGLAQIEQQSSRAEAMLRDAAQRASLDAIGLARGGNRRDRAFLERQAIAEGQFNQQQAGRDAATLRAQEEVDRNNLRLAAFQAAGQLGLNAGALELDAERLDMESATNWLNNEFENHRLGLQLDEAEAQRVANFARDMALIEQQYYSLTQQEQQHIRDDLTRRYGISEGTRLAMEQLERSDDFNWNTFVGGLVSGGSAAGAAYLGRPS